MKRLLITQGMQRIAARNETRDGLDQRMTRLVLDAGHWPLLMPNWPDASAAVWDLEPIDGLILTGGESSTHYGGTQPQRDAAELHALQQAMQRRVPVLGICRGMQLIQQAHGQPLHNVPDHVGTLQSLTWQRASRFCQRLPTDQTVCTHHTLGSRACAHPLQAAAHSEDGVVMALSHAEQNVFGVMWHPERQADGAAAVALLNALWPRTQ